VDGLNESEIALSPRSAVQHPFVADPGCQERIYRGRRADFYVNKKMKKIKRASARSHNLFV